MLAAKPKPMNKRRYVPGAKEDEDKLSYQLQRSIVLDWHDSFQELVSSMDDINEPVTGRNKWTVLTFAVQKRRFEFVKTCLAAGADPNFPDQVTKKTCLHMACTNGDGAICRLLLQSGRIKDINARDADGFTPLLAAVKKGRMFCVKLLLDERIHKQTCDINIALSKNKQTALWMACDKGDLEIVNLLLNYKLIQCDMDIADAKGYTSLMKATAKEQFAVVELLLSKGAEINAVNSLLQCATVIALRTKNFALSCMLLGMKGNGVLYRKDHKERSVMKQCSEFHVGKEITAFVRNMLFRDIHAVMEEINHSEQHTDVPYLPNAVVKYICNMTY